MTYPAFVLLMIALMFAIFALVLHDVIYGPEPKERIKNAAGPVGMAYLRLIVDVFTKWLNSFLKGSK